ncbi:MAG: RNA 2',3'-cyclic phosphodiesterase [Chloroflexota bacterium]|nr:MAG: RNA 2',3'-cyclic phosphodiesterase [Chloroflexota bacterium]
MAQDIIRAFIAINLPADVRDSLEQVISNLQEQLPAALVRWVDSDKIHLTLKFLGDISSKNLEIVKKIVASEAAKRHTMEIGIGGIGAFPKTHHPRVIWIGVEAPSELDDLRRGIETGVARLGYERDKYDFTPHLTLGRVSRKTSGKDIRKVGDVLHNFSVGYLGAARVDAVHVYRSDLRSDGPTYTRLFTAKLAEDNGQVVV